MTVNIDDWMFESPAIRTTAGALCFLGPKKQSTQRLGEHAALVKIAQVRGAVWLRTLPLSRRSWHLFKQSGLLVNSTKAFSAWSRVVVSVVSYSCLHRFSSWARLWNKKGGGG